MGAEDQVEVVQSVQTPSAPYALPYTVMQAGNNSPQPVFYIPQPVQFATPNLSIQENEMHSLIQNSDPVCERRTWGGCRTWGNKRNEGCGWTDDGRPLGSFQDFIVSVVFGTISPVLAIVMMYGMETSKLSRLGAIFGTANSFILLSAILTSYAQHYKNVEARHIQTIVPLILGLIALVIALKCWRRFLYIYRRRENKTEQERVRVISQIGSCGDFAASFFVSLLLPVFGALISVIIKRKSLLGRYGALSGFGFFLIILGTGMTFKGVPPVPLVAGIFIMEFTLVHFRRALVCAETTQNTSTITA